MKGNTLLGTSHSIHLSMVKGPLPSLQVRSLNEPNAPIIHGFGF